MTGKTVCSATSIRYLCAMPQTLLVYSTCPDRQTALEIADFLIQDGLAACVNVSAPATSVFEWEGKVEHAEEVVLTIKSGIERYRELEDAIRARHPYELPEIIAVPIQQGLPEYLQWVEQCIKAEN